MTNITRIDRWAYIERPIELKTDAIKRNEIKIKEVKEKIDDYEEYIDSAIGHSKDSLFKNIQECKIQINKLRIEIDNYKKEIEEIENIDIISLKRKNDAALAARTEIDRKYRIEKEIAYLKRKINRLQVQLNEIEIIGKRSDNEKAKAELRKKYHSIRKNILESKSRLSDLRD